MDQTYRQIFLRFLRFGFLAWGGPVAQIAMIKKELVNEEKWITVEQFNRALAVYQVLPGPEAHELCVYFGMRAGGRWGGFLAGLGFMLPGFLLMLLLTWVYVTFGINSPILQQIFTGIQAAVVALICFAVYRIGRHAIINFKLLAIAVASAAAFYVGAHFLLVLILAGAIYVFWNKNSWLAIIPAILLIAISAYSILINENSRSIHIENSQPINYHNATQGQVFVTGLKAGLLSFGGAYTSIPIVQDDAVVNHRWMSQEQFLNGIALSGILPAPLIIFATFVGYFGGGWLGAIIITLGVFLPAFSFTLIGHQYMERLIANTSLHNFLDGVTAGVVGLIGLTAINLLIAMADSLTSIVIIISGIFILYKFRSKYTVIFLILGAGLAGLLIGQV